MHAIHLEIANSLETDSFLTVVRKFLERWDNIRQMRSDNGSNFVGAVRELKISFQDMDHKRTQEYLQSVGGDCLTWVRNPPVASHISSVWERKN